MAVCTKTPCDHAKRGQHCVVTDCPNNVFTCPEHKITIGPGR